MRLSAAILVSASLLWVHAGQYGLTSAPAAEPSAAPLHQDKEPSERIRVGDMVIVVADMADVTWEGKVIARIPRAGTFRVLQVRRDAVAGWIKILNREDIEWTKRGHEIGWVRRDQVALAKPDQIDPAAPPVARATAPDLPAAAVSQTPTPPAPETAGPVELIPPGDRLPRKDDQGRRTLPVPDTSIPSVPVDALAETKGVVAETPGVESSDAGHFSCHTFSGANCRLCVAVSDGHSEEVRRLLAAGADINARSERSHTQGMTLLQVAIWNEWSIEKIQLLIQAGADVNAVDGRGRTALMYAAARQPAVDPGLVRLLIAAGADVNAREKRGMTALMHASMHDDPQVVKMLVDAGADVRARDEAGWTALMHATRRTCGNTEVVQLLIRSNADVNAAHRYGGTALASAAFNGHVRAVEVLLKAGARVNSTDTGGWTPLICACTSGHREIAALLIAAGADVRTADRLGRTPLSIASGSGMAETADLLVRAGAW